MSNTYSAGIATAYGAAVRGGYTGTYDEWCAMMADYAAVEGRAATAATNAADSATAAAVSETNAASSQSAAALSAIAAGNSEQAALAASVAAQSAETDARASKAAAASSASNAASSATAAATSEAAARAVQESIPQDYTAMSGNVDKLISLIPEHDETVELIASWKTEYGIGDRPMSYVKVNMLPTQSGNPSPTNVRAIGGRQGLTVSHSDGTESQSYSASWSSVAGTVYGGVVDLISGLITLTWARWAPSSETIPHSVTDMGDGYTRVTYAGTGVRPPYPAADSTSGLYSHGKYYTHNTEKSDHAYVNTSATPIGYIFIKCDPTKEAAQAYLAAQEQNNTPVEVVYKIAPASPVTYQITGRTITTLEGTNILTSTSGTIEASIPVHIKPYLDYWYKGANPQWYRYEASGNNKTLYIYHRSGDNFVRWQLHNIPSAAINSNTWQIGPVYGLDADLANETLLVDKGEFELAFKEHGAADFCGGNNHGDENTDSFALFIDGKQITLANLDGEYHPFNRIDAIEIATVNRCDTPSVNILKHQKVWTFEDGKVKVLQTIKYLTELSVDGALVCMFSATRAAFPYGVRHGLVGIEDYHTSGFSDNGTDSNEIFYEYYGPNATAKIRAKTDYADGTSKLWIADNSSIAPYKNKLYYTYYGRSVSQNSPVTVPANTIITAESEYDVAYTPAT